MRLRHGSSAATERPKMPTRQMVFIPPPPSCPSGKPSTSIRTWREGGSRNTARKRSAIHHTATQTLAEQKDLRPQQKLLASAPRRARPLDGLMAAPETRSSAAAATPARQGPHLPTSPAAAIAGPATTH